MTKPDEADAVLMHMQWEPIDIIMQVHQQKNIMEIYVGGFARLIVLIMQPECWMMAGSIGVLIESTVFVMVSALPST